MAKIKREYIVAVLVLAAIVVLAWFYFNGSSPSNNSSARDSAQDAYDLKVVRANDQIAILNNFSLQWQSTMTVDQLKGFLDDYRSNVTTLAGMVNDTNKAGDGLKGYLQAGSSEYASVTSNEQALHDFLAAYITDYNRDATSYNNNVGAQLGNVPLI